MNPLNREFQRLLVSSGWSQARAAAELRLDAGTVSRYVAGTVSPSETVLRLFAEILGERLVIDGAVVPPSRAIGARYVEEYEIKLIEALRVMPAEARKRICDAVTLLSDCVGLARPAAQDAVGRAKSAIVAKGNAMIQERRARQSAEASGAATEPKSGAREMSAPRSRRQSSHQGHPGS